MPLKQVTSVRRDVTAHWVGDGFPVRSLFSYFDDAEAIDPFLLLDYASPTDFPPSAHRRGVEVHPHRGFETVTIVYQGELEHRDSGGHAGAIGPGDVQWMTAASGVVHEEFHGRNFTERGGILEMAQLWVNLPASAKMSAPRYQEIRATEIPTVELASGCPARVIAGELDGTTGPAQTVTPLNVWDLRLAAGSSVRLPIPAGHTAILLLRSGSIAVGSSPLEGISLAHLDRAGDGVDLSSTTDSTLLALSGPPIGEPVVGRGPFVMNTTEEIRQAIADFQSGKMGRL
jgi:redox-sensitive bicupin YhaK (pirin superfamily)